MTPDVVECGLHSQSWFFILEIMNLILNVLKGRGFGVNLCSADFIGIIDLIFTFLEVHQ